MSGSDGDVPVPPGATEHLKLVDPVLAGIIEKVGVIAPTLETDLWWALVEAIVGQQLSVAAAATIVSRVRTLGDGAVPSPDTVIAVPDEDLRALGLSRAKALYVKDLAARWLDGTLQPDRLRSLADAEIVDQLVQVKGIGRWTAEMALIFSLGRPDVLPVGDLGLRVAVQLAYGLAERPGAEELTRLGQVWQPFRTAATLYLWQSRRIG